MDKAGWNQPLEVNIRMKLPEVAGALLEGYDESGIGKVTGRLRSSLALSSGNYRARRTKGGDVIEWSTDLPYARIQDVGGRVPTRYPRRARAMRWIDSSGEVIFARKARGFVLPGFRFLSVHGMKALERRLGIISEVKWKDERNGR